MADLRITNEGEGLICELIVGKVAPESLRLALYGTGLTISDATTLANCVAQQVTGMSSPAAGYAVITSSQWTVTPTSGGSAGGATVSTNVQITFTWTGAGTAVKGVYLYHNTAQKLIACGDLDTTYQAGSGGGTLTISIDGLTFTNV